MIPQLEKLSVRFPSYFSGSEGFRGYSAFLHPRFPTCPGETSHDSGVCGEGLDFETTGCQARVESADHGNPGRLAGGS
jgi:hypothetical protein